jgi:hypothetical protein
LKTGAFDVLNGITIPTISISASWDKTNFGIATIQVAF